MLMGIGITVARYTATKWPLQDMLVAMGWGVLFGLSSLIENTVLAVVDPGLLAAYVALVFFIGFKHNSYRTHQPLVPPVAAPSQFGVEQQNPRPRPRTWSTALIFSVTSTATMSVITILAATDAAMHDDGTSMYELGIIFGPPILWLKVFPVSFFVFGLGIVFGRKRAEKQSPPPSLSAGS